MAVDEATKELIAEMARALMLEQKEAFQEEMKKMQDEMKQEIKSLKEELSKKTSDTSPSKQDDDNGSEARGKEPGSKGVYSSVGFDYSQPVKATHTPSVNLGKPPHFDGTRYPDWAYKMKMHLIAANLWEVVDVGVTLPADDREITPEEAQTFRQNAQAVAIIIGKPR